VGEVSEPVLQVCQLTMPNMAHLYTHIKENAPYATRMVQPDQCKGKTVAICGAGASLADNLDMVPTTHVWACNSALPYLAGRGARVTHGFCIDQGEEMLEPHEWGNAYDVQYLIASSVHPKLVRHLLTAKRKLTWFHSYLGIPEPDHWVSPLEDTPNYEMYLYRTIYPTSVQVGYGLNAVPRAVCLALFMGYKRIYVYGADCACAPNGPPMHALDCPQYVPWMERLRMYADGRTAAWYGPKSAIAEAVLDGKRWHTRAYMVISARHLVDLQKTYPGRIEFVGDTLVNASRDKDAEFWDAMPTLTGLGKVEQFGTGACDGTCPSVDERRVKELEAA